VVRVKICGITNLEDARACVGSGVDALGFVFYKKSPRYISPPDAASIIGELPKHVIKVGVFVNSKEKDIRKAAGMCGLNMLQFHGEESPAFCDRFKDYKIIKAFRVKDCIDEKKIRRYNTFAYLFDTFDKDTAGGTGRSFNWKLIRHIGRLKRPVFLSGGLNASNVQKALQCAKPRWVDVSGGVEAGPGKKDYKKVARFIKKAKG